ncbi:FAD-binding domain-containing protein [Amniculicola lignicola CBS 123094]|uniref:Delta(24)-sterol reductase n=1 Tax=Amniculicola lignicola CBS 123094 TaxID=1392246 RepID=A0A6A5WE86_9PLEO|nr:FAD-binding domain-containing protein [Amniculicola lignicola CBS 123094]
MDDIHKTTVERICKDTRRFYETKSKFRVYHGSTNSTRHAKFDRDAIIDVSTLNRVLSIDVKRKTALVEPNVPMDALVRETKKAGLLPPVVMEFPGITVGGGFVGTAGESSSFKYGFFDRTVNWAEVVLANGTVVKASETEHPDLFNGLAGSFGTLGVLTLVELRLIDIKKFVELTYHPVASIKESISKTQEETLKEENDYVDGIILAKNNGAIISGRLTDEVPRLSMLQMFSRAWDPWFYLHAEEMVRNGKPHKEFVPIEDYLFRYDRGAFWTGMYGFKFFWTPFNWFTRLLLDYFMHTRVMYHALHASGHTDRYIIQDLALPANNAAAFINYIDSRFGLYPLWLCPLPPNTRGSMAHPHSLARNPNAANSTEPEQYINVGVWGPYPSSQDEYVNANRDLEQKVRDFGGLKWLYARAFYTEEEFWHIYDEKSYKALREKYKATSLPTVYEKVREDLKKKEAMYDTGFKGQLKRIVLSTNLTRGFYGVYKAIRGGDYLLSKKQK